MDSRSYIFIYPLKTSGDIPLDFSPEIRSLPFEMGIFMPQDDSNWFTRPPKYPARLLLLEGRCLHIIPHPTSEESPIKIYLDDLLQLETGSVLLLGWIKFTTISGVQNLIYNTRASRSLEKFLGILKRRWLDTVPPIPNVRTESYGDELDIKFNYSMRSELERDEAVLVRYFETPVRSEKKVLFFRRVSWRPGHLVLLTSRNRIVWITDQYRGSRELYASVSVSAPCALLQSCKTNETEEGQETLVITFDSGPCWRIPSHDGSPWMSSMCQKMNQLAQPLVPNKAS